jgi:hypothetical protein
MSLLDRKHVRLYSSHAAAEDGGYMAGTAAERLSQVWELTQEIWPFTQGKHAEQRLQRDVAVLITNISVEGLQDLADVERLESEFPERKKPV